MLPPIARRFVAGESPAAALQHASEVTDDGVGVILNHLGEHYDDPDAVREDAATYRGLIDDVADAGLRTRISVKPSQLGLDVDEALFRETLADVVARGVERDVLVWIDMEDRETTDATLDAYETLAREHDGGVGVCLQANLRRTRDDVERLADVPGRVRFVKGAYDEPAAVAYTDQERVNRELRELLTLAAETFEAGEIALGSHDPSMIDHALSLQERHDRNVELQFLMGVREEAQRDLARRGHDVWQYAPFGSRWKSYFYRRVRERKENLLFVARAIVGR